MKPETNDPNSPTSSLWERSSLVRFFRWMFSGRILRRIAMGAAWIATVIALAYGVENWRARRAWNSYRTGLEARGAQLDLAALIPKPIPDERNLAATPFIQSWFQRPNYGDPWDDDFDRATQATPRPTKAQPSRDWMDLAAWALALESAATNREKRELRRVSAALASDTFTSRSNAAAAVLGFMVSSEPRLAELREAARRPEARYPVQYNLDNPWGILMPHLAKVRVAGLRLQLRACARLSVGDASGALDDVVLGLTLADSLQGEPFVISTLVRFASVQLMLQPIWEGLAEHRWSEDQLKILQACLSGHNFLADLDRSLSTERAAALLTADLLAQRKFRFSQLDGDSTGGVPAVENEAVRDLAGSLAPRGWYQLEKLNYCRLLDRQTSGAFDAVARRVSPARIASNAEELEREISSGRIRKDLAGVFRHQFLASIMLPGLQEFPFKAAVAQTALDEAMLACALERFRLAEGAYPESLDALVPKWVSPMPNDVLTGEPYRYRRTADGQFILYSVGWNLKDEGGVSGATQFDRNQGDWVWEYPEP